jgi:hypothetical protein
MYVDEKEGKKEDKQRRKSKKQCQYVKGEKRRET